MSTGNIIEVKEKSSRIISLVNADYLRIMATEDPYEILGIDENHTSFQELIDSYNHYDQFYQLDKFKKLGNSDLIKKVFVVREGLEKAINQINKSYADRKNKQHIPNSNTNLHTNDGRKTSSSNMAMSRIYYKDGITYLKLNDFKTAVHYFQLSHDFDNSNAVALAYLAYTIYRLDENKQGIKDETVSTLQKAIAMDENSEDIMVLMARLYLGFNNRELSVHWINKLEQQNPDHPKIDHLYLELKKIPI